jgi:TrmH family RNA methyltransferase
MLVKQKIKYIQSLGQKKFRDEEGLFVAEGPKLVKELLGSDRSFVKEIYALQDWIEENKELTGKVLITEITGIELERISQLSTPNKVLAIVRQYDAPAPTSLKGRITLVLDTIQDPGNMGTIVRIADWFGVEQVVCSNDCVDIYNTKVVQSTMGSIGRVKFYYTDLPEWLALQNEVSIYAAALDGQDISTMKKINEGILIIGNESRGISPKVMDLAHVKITIPKKGAAESLNAALAAGIILSHIC